MKRVLLVLLTLTFSISLVSFTSCSFGDNDKQVMINDGEDSSENTNNVPVTITFFSSNPDTTQGLGYLEELRVQAFMESYPHITVEQEKIHDDPYHIRFNAYLVSGKLPDVFKSWSGPYFMIPVINGGFAAELDPADYADYGFISGALDAYTFDDKLYGIPMYADSWVLYYNKSIFDEFNVKVPTTFNEMISASDIFRENDLQPCAINGGDEWPWLFTFQNIVLRETGDQDYIFDVTAGKDGMRFQTEADMISATQQWKRLIDANVFADGFNSSDYGTAKNMFVTGQSAMLLMGSWEMGMGSDPNLDDEVKSNIRATKFPAIEGKGDIDDLVFRIGGGYTMNAQTEHPEEALLFLNFMTSMEIYAKQAWELGITQVPMDVSGYVTGNESNVQKDLAYILGDSKTAAGQLWANSYSSRWTEEVVATIIAFTNGILSVEEYLTELDRLADEEIRE